MDEFRSQWRIPSSLYVFIIKEFPVCLEAQGPWEKLKKQYNPFGGEKKIFNF